MAKVTFIWHDCFVVETADANLVFDYWLDSDGEARAFPDFLNTLDAGKPLYVLVSHGHKDHYNPAIFGWARLFGNIHFIVSKDIRNRIRHILSESSVYSGPKIRESQLTVLRPGETYSDDILSVRAFPSTDIGAAYLIEMDRQSFFHAGDLNAWVMADDSSEREINKALGDYKACLKAISEYLDTAHDGKDIDYCFFPVDSRIGSKYFLGAAMFVTNFKVRRFFPMHFDLGDNEEREIRRRDALDFNKYANLTFGEYIPLAVNGSCYLSND